MELTWESNPTSCLFYFGKEKVSVSRKKVERNIAYDDARKVYYVTLNYGKEAGRQQKSYQTAKSINEARRVLRAHEVARDKGAVTAPTDEKLEQWIEFWLETIVRPGREATTYYAYRRMWENHIRPMLGSIKLKDLSPQKLQAYYSAAMSAKGLSSNTVRKHHDLLRAALHRAVFLDKIGTNPTDRVEPPKVKAPDRRFYGPRELQQLLALDMEGWLRVVVYLAGYLGLRREEICGLRWECVDFELHQINIKFARTEAGGHTVEKAPKNKSSERLLYCPQELEAVLLNELHQQEVNQTVLGSSYCTEGFVVAWEDGQPVRPNYVSDRFSKLVKDNGLPPLTLHGLRHSFASIANAQGASLFDIGKALGHSTPSTTGKIYTHILDHTHEGTVVRVSHAIGLKTNSGG